MKIGIVGGGSIGLLVSSFLCKEHRVSIYVRREEQKQKINGSGIYLSGSPMKFSVQALLLEELKQEECLIICVKQSQLSTVLPIIKKQKKDTPFIFLQNGMGHIELLHMENPLYLGVFEHGALRESDHIVRHTGKGMIKVAVFQGEKTSLDLLVNQLNQAHFPVQVAADWKILLYEKLIVNAVINPLTALFHVKNGEIVYNAYINHIAKELCREATRVVNLDFQKQWDRVEKIAENTKENISSMLKDIKKKQKTEIEAITGFIIKQSKDIVNVPYTTFVYNGVRALEIQKRIRENDN